VSKIKRGKGTRARGKRKRHLERKLKIVLFNQSIRSIAHCGKKKSFLPPLLANLYIKPGLGESKEKEVSNVPT